MNIEEFMYGQKKQKLDLSDIDKEYLELMLREYIEPHFDEILGILKRSITIKEIISVIYPKPVRIGDTHLVQSVADVKARYMVMDAKYLLDKGFTELWFLDLVPGDAAIGYEIHTTGDE